jgi:hypothetical protein
MTEEALNRIGILLNFAAGFLLAPQLIGLDRIKKAERWAESTAANAHGTAGQRVASRQERERRSAGAYAGFPEFDSPLSFRDIAGLAMGVALFVALGWGAVRILHDDLGFPVWLALVAAVFAGWAVVACILAVILRLVVIPLVWPVMLVFVLYRVRPTVSYQAARATGFSAGWIVRKLEGDDRLLGLLTGVGVICFVVGNALQFLATFR